MVISGLAGFALLWWLRQKADQQSGDKRHGFFARLREDWTSADPVGAMGVGWLIVGCLALITIGLIGLDG
jgi:hypothetical protein